MDDSGFGNLINQLLGAGITLGTQAAQSSLGVPVFMGYDSNGNPLWQTPNQGVVSQAPAASNNTMLLILAAVAVVAIILLKD